MAFVRYLKMDKSLDNGSTMYSIIYLPLIIALCKAPLCKHPLIIDKEK